MSIEVRPCASLDELRSGLNAIGHYFGHDNTEEDAERFAQWIELDRMHLAFDGDSIVGAAGAFTFAMSVPGGATIPAGGVTVVGVLPTHRRRGVLTEMMRAQLDDCRRRGDAAAYLWASESTIYGRFGYGLASLTGEMKLARERTAFAQPFTGRGTVRLVDAGEAARVFPPLYEQVREQRPGMFARSQAWWETRKLAVMPWAKAGPKQYALLEVDGEPVGYAIYTVQQEWRSGSSTGTVTVVEAIAPTAAATRELWRWLLDFDWTSQFQAGLLPLDHPLFLLLAEPRRMEFRLGDGIWVRLLDLEAAFSARSFAREGTVVVEVTDAFRPETTGRWRLGDGGAERTSAEPELALDVAGLGSVYLGGFGVRELVAASRAQELVPGAATRADELLRTAVEPWCPEIF
jgi:predicted acetyltransferase